MQYPRGEELDQGKAHDGLAIQEQLKDTLPPPEVLNQKNDQWNLENSEESQSDVSQKELGSWGTRLKFRDTHVFAWPMIGWSLLRI